MLRRTWEYLAAFLTGIPSTSEVRSDPWRRLRFEPPIRAFGPGAFDDFTSHLSGESAVHIQTPQEAAEWFVETEVERIVRPLAEVRDEYEPQVGVTPVAARYVYAGLFLSDWGRRLSLRRLPGSG